MYIEVFIGHRRSGGICEANGMMVTNSNNLYFEIKLVRILSVSRRYVDIIL